MEGMTQGRSGGPWAENGHQYEYYRMLQFGHFAEAAIVVTLHGRH
jgi:hypothetical protein